MEPMGLILLIFKVDLVLCHMYFRSCQLWHHVRSCTWEPSAYACFGSKKNIRPLQWNVNHSQPLLVFWGHAIFWEFEYVPNEHVQRTCAPWLIIMYRSVLHLAHRGNIYGWWCIVVDSAQPSWIIDCGRRNVRRTMECAKWSDEYYFWPLAGLPWCVCICVSHCARGKATWRVLVLSRGSTRNDLIKSKHGTLQKWSRTKAHTVGNENMSGWKNKLHCNNNIPINEINRKLHVRSSVLRGTGVSGAAKVVKENRTAAVDGAMLEGNHHPSWIE